MLIGKPMVSQRIFGTLVEVFGLVGGKGEAEDLADSVEEVQEVEVQGGVGKKIYQNNEQFFCSLFL